MHLASTTFLCSYITLLVTGVKDLSLHCNFCLFEQCRKNVLFCGHFEQYIYKCYQLYWAVGNVGMHSARAVVCVGK